MARYLKISADTLENEGRRLEFEFPASWEKLTEELEPREYLAMKHVTGNDPEFLDNNVFVILEEKDDVVFLFEGGGCELYVITPPKHQGRWRL
jgi:hypothetical protein